MGMTKPRNIHVLGMTWTVSESLSLPFAIASLGNFDMNASVNDMERLHKWLGNSIAYWHAAIADEAGDHPAEEEPR